jgi:hypothetical protein
VFFLSHDTLRKFVKQRALLGDSPEKLREGLILNGWDRKDVERVISEVYYIKKKIRFGFIMFVVLLIVFFSVSLLLIFGDFKIVDDVPINPPFKPVVSDACAFISDIVLKEDCYLEEIKNGFSCQGLSDEESFFCSRVLEVYLLDSFDS